MPATTASPGRAAARPAGRTAGRKSPLRVVNELPPFTFDDEPGVESAAARARNRGTITGSGCTGCCSGGRGGPAQVTSAAADGARAWWQFLDERQTAA